MKLDFRIFIVVIVIIGGCYNLSYSQQGGQHRSAKARIDGEFLYAIQIGDVVKFHRFLKRGANVNARREARTSALMVASLNGQTAFLAVLIAKGAKVNAKNIFGNTALINAASFGQIEMVRWLLAAGANVQAKNESGLTALNFASDSAYAKTENYQKVIELLKRHGAK